ncbi:MAG: Uma2 family endonuclease [Planctomycetota bacterium]|nr:Uma2 family endonuclease [Planctomycetota bacterium]
MAAALTQMLGRELAIAPIQTGDRMNREEFERRYETMPGIKAELVEGVAYVMSSPVSNDNHGAPHADLIGWLVFYRAQTPGTEVADNATVRLDWDNEPQPDALLRILPECGGQSRSEDGYVVLAPELVVEISASSKSFDLHDKKNVYRRNGVREYIVWRTEDAELDWFVLRGGSYEQLETGEDGIRRSEVFPGLWLDADALLANNMRRVLEVLQLGLGSSEHQEFVDRSLQGRVDASAE